MVNVIVYGISNCDTVKKTCAWLQARSVPLYFHDFKKQGVPPDRLAHWMQDVGWQNIVNRKSTTWRKLTADMQASVVDAESAAQLLVQNASAIKRPVIVWPSGCVTVGFDPARWESLIR